MDFRGPMFHFCKWFLQTFRSKYQAPPVDAFVQPAVYVCRHHNVKGPILSLTYMPVPVRPWVFHVFADRKLCYEHCLNFTFTKRFGWRRLRAKVSSFLVAPLFSRLIRSAGGIPVYRNSLKLRDTFHQSIAALLRGENLLIFPDIDYTSTVADTGNIYEGFLFLEQLYYKMTGAHIPFIPLHISDSRRMLVVGEKVLFTGEHPFDTERKEISARLIEEMNRLSLAFGE